MDKLSSTQADIPLPRPPSLAPSRASFPDVLLRRRPSLPPPGAPHQPWLRPEHLLPLRRPHISRCVVSPAAPRVRLICLAGSGSNTPKTGALFSPQTSSPLSPRAKVVDFSPGSLISGISLPVVERRVLYSFGRPITPEWTRMASRPIMLAAAPRSSFLRKSRTFPKVSFVSSICVVHLHQECRSYIKMSFISGRSGKHESFHIHLLRSINILPRTNRVSTARREMH